MTLIMRMQWLLLALALRTPLRHHHDEKRQSVATAAQSEAVSLRNPIPKVHADSEVRDMRRKMEILRGVHQMAQSCASAHRCHHNAGSRHVHSSARRTHGCTWSAAL
mmetsp:Transcript_123512/g.195863  ORF Transcript_123512/g.195863 Transcript_123512/m.195863 type:complete len:107 (-) Transcript_123512:125-445(-)